MTTSQSRRRRVTAVAGLVALGVVAAACGSDKPSTSATTTAAAATTTAAAATTAAATTAAPTTAAATTTTTASGVTTAGITAERCAANKAAGKITYLTSFDFAAAASILDVVVAKDKGYFDKMCLDVDLKPGLLDHQLPAGGQQPGPVLVGRQLHRDPQLHHGWREVRGHRRLRQDPDRGAARPGRRQDQPR